MSPIDFLQLATELNNRINIKIERLDNLKSLATRTSQVMSDMPHSPNRGNSSLENVYVKIIDLEEEINSDVDMLVDIQEDIAFAIQKIPNYSARDVFTKRYLSFMSWTEIAEALHFSYKHVNYLHREYLSYVKVPEKYNN